VRRGIVVRNFGSFADVRRVAASASAAEERGWDGFFLWDHIHWTGWPMGGRPAPVDAIDPWIALGVIAAGTDRIRMGTLVTPLPRRRPWKLARETVTLDHLSNGRLILGVGLGSPEDADFSQLGEPASARERALRLDEGLDVLTKLWSGETIDYAGKAYRLDGVRMLPRPVQQPRIPIIVAGLWPGIAPFRRAARWDGVVPIDRATGSCSPERVADVLTVIRRDGAVNEGFEVMPWEPHPDTPNGPSEARMQEYEAAGATWWLDHPVDLGDLERLLATGRSA
jgi:alkanesulfonate monooxygenase SsuD/methylene tetrahydromethanopterin reductase-like flavin-dependent oxidoreductase (luciferase family)